jgi:HEAT repeat protein
LTPNPAPTATQGPNVEQLLLVLTTSSFALQREWAAQQLLLAEWHGHPGAVPTLVTCAFCDAASNVRVACIRCLGQKRAAAQNVIEALRTLADDDDAQVRQEARQSLHRHGADAAVSSAPSVGTARSN